MWRGSLLVSSLVAHAVAHMPAEAGRGTREDPVDLGDPTVNSWALTGEMIPEQVYHYKFTIPGPTPTDSKRCTEEGCDSHMFFLGMYVPGAGEPDFTFYVAVFGMPNTTACARWGDGWGRRRLNHPDALDIGASPHRITSEGTTWLADSTKIPSRVLGNSSDDLPFYHQPEETLVFIASPTTDLPNKFEAFSPTLFKPRGSCIADFPRGGEYRMAVWGDADQLGPKRFSVGIGLAERDVFAPLNLIKFGYTLHEIQRWNHWNGFVLVLPIIVCVLLALTTLIVIKLCAPHPSSPRLCSPLASPPPPGDLRLRLLLPPSAISRAGMAPRLAWPHPSAHWFSSARQSSLATSS